MHQEQQQAARAVTRVLEGANLRDALAEVDDAAPLRGRTLVAELAYGTLRHFGMLDALTGRLARKPIPDARLRALIVVALYQLDHTRAPAFAVVDRAVVAAGMLAHPGAKGLVNALLRRYLRERTSLHAALRASEVAGFSHPQWWIDRVRRDHPTDWAAILDAGNARPPLTLRVNRRRISRDDYLQLLAQQELAATAVGADGATLARAVPVERLPGFADGLVSVQDAAAQLAAPLLDAQPRMRVLDACAAPGGKTTHLLELADLALTAIDHDAGRLVRVQQNLSRLGLAAALKTADVNDVAVWWDGQPFERILADVPCSASGVVRRHPDIKWLRRASDPPRFVKQQQLMLDALWRLLASGGKLLYTTCSIFQEENSLQAADFLARHADARQLPLSGVRTLDGTPDGQLLPDNEHDGFFYALLQKV